MIYTDVELVNLYSEWSEESYAAGFMIPDESSCREFVRWLNRRELGIERSWDELYDRARALSDPGEEDQERR